MKKNHLVIFAVTVALILSMGSISFAREEYEKIQKERINSLLAAINSADEGKITEFLKANWILDSKNTEERISKMVGTKEQMGEMKIISISHDSKETCSVDIECFYNVQMTLTFLPENNYLIEKVELKATQ